jgi:pilus assembly protein Flp/PilA
MQTKFTSLYEFAMKVLARAEYRLMRRWQETTGQDLVEYALMAGFVAVAAGALIPPVPTSISTIFSKITSLLTRRKRPGQLVFIGLRGIACESFTTSPS